MIRAPHRSAGREAATRPGAFGTRTLVKVCGITRLEDARAAVEAGADWIGMIVSGDSPRRIAPERAAAIASALSGATVVAVMVGERPADALALAQRVGAQRVQIHRAPEVWPEDFAIPAAIVVGVDAAGRLVADPPHGRHLLMLDTAHAEKAGGTGETFPWDAAILHARARLVMIAGGLSPDNVAEAVRRVRPFGVDASSALESAPGIKDRELIRRFIRAVRDAERLAAEGGA